jgi:hypothetical protein
MSTLRWVDCGRIARAGIRPLPALTQPSPEPSVSYDPNHPYGQQYQVPVVPSAPPSSPGPYGHMYPPPLVVAAPSPPTSGWATAALVIGILGALGGWCMLGIPCLVAVIAGHVGLNDTRDGTRGGRGMAVAGLVLGYVFVVPWALFFFLGGVGAGLNAVTPTPTP